MSYLSRMSRQYFIMEATVTRRLLKCEWVLGMLEGLPEMLHRTEKWLCELMSL
jgi:hypothetical protein